MDVDGNRLAPCYMWDLNVRRRNVGALGNTCICHIMAQWSRPDSVPLGQVWSRFRGRELNGAPAKMYQIRDLDEEHTEQCLDLMLETFLADEPLCITLGINDDPESIATIKSNWIELMKQNVSLACYTEVDGEPTELVAFNIIMVKTIHDDEEDLDTVKGESWKKLLKTLIAAEEMVNVFKYYGVDKYMSSSGLTVSRNHRGQNIGARMMAAREPFCKALGIKATCTVYTATTSQVLAVKSGYQVLAELPYTKMLDEGIDLTGCETSSAKVMGKSFDL